MSKRPSQKSLNLPEPPLDPKLAAQFGPLDLKEPGSEAWIIQTIFKAQGIWHSLDRDTREWHEVVARLDGQQVWNKYPVAKPYKNRDTFYRQELGAPEPLLTQLKETQQLLVKGVNQYTLNKNGGSRNARSLGKSDTAAYITARLKRDGHAELLAKIERGEMTAHAAAVQMNWRKRTVAVMATVEGFARAVERHLTPDERQQLAIRLNGSGV